MGQPAAAADQRIGRHHCRTAAVGHDGQPVAAKRPRQRQRFCRHEQIERGFDAKHSGTTKGGIVDVVGTGQCPGMGGGSLGGFRDTPRFHCDDRLVARCCARRGHELARVRDRFDIQKDRRGRGVRCEIVEHVAEVDVCGIAERDEMRKTDPAGIRPVEQCRGERTGLGYESDLSRACAGMGEAGIQSDRRHQQSDAVRSEYSQQVRFRGVQHGLRQGAALGIGNRTQTGGQHHRSLAAPGAELVNDTRDGLRRRADHREVGHPIQASHFRNGAQAGHARVLRIDREDGAGVAPREQIAHHRGAEALGPVGGADHGNRVRTKQVFEIAYGHSRCSLFFRWLRNSAA